MRFLIIRPVQGWAVRRPALILALFALVVLLAAACRQQPNVPESNGGVGMHRANPARTGVYQTNGPTEYESIKWQFEADDWAFGAPAIANGTVYFTSYDGRVYAADTETGAEKWRFDTGATIIASPAVSDGLVYIANMAGSLLALDAESGQERWRVETETGQSGSPAVVDGVVYFGGESGLLVALDAGSLADAAGGWARTLRADLDGLRFVLPAGGRGSSVGRQRESTRSHVHPRRGRDLHVPFRRHRRHEVRAIDLQHHRFDTIRHRGLAHDH